MKTYICKNVNSHFPTFTYLYLYGTFAYDLSLSRLSFPLLSDPTKSMVPSDDAHIAGGWTVMVFHNTRAIHEDWIRTLETFVDYH